MKTRMTQQKLLIGTHNSACHTLDWDVSFWKSGEKFETVRRVCKWFYPLRKLIELFTCTQAKTISQQLHMNIDVLDLRISQANNVFYTSHTFCCSSVEDVLMEIYLYLNSTERTQPLNLFFTPDFENTHTMRGKEKEFLDLVVGWLDQFMYTHQVNVYYQPLDLDLDEYNRELLDEADKKTYLTEAVRIYHYQDIQNIWYNVDTIEAYTSKLNHTLFMGYTCLNAVLTPRPPETFKQYIQYLFKDSLMKTADLVNHLTLNILKTRSNRPSICIFDFVDSEFVYDFRQLD